MITQEELKNEVDYDQETGFFTWSTSRAGAKKGARCGCVVTSRGKSYISIKIARKSYYAHKLSWVYVNGYDCDVDIDHINGNGLDNKISNLRRATRAENNKNKKLHKNNSSGACGVRWRKERSRWVSSIKVNGNPIYLGSFLDIDEAIKAREDANIKYGFHINHGKPCKG